MNEWLKNVTEKTFDTEVIGRSAEVPVVVDFWAPWCGPCRSLGPVLERLATEARGAFVLAKVNVDENPKIAAEFGIRSIPAVKAIRDGEIVDEFVGALPEAAVRSFLERILPTEADRLAADAQAAEARGEAATAESLYRKALEGDANHPRGRLGLGRLLAGSDADAALAELDRVLPGTPERAEADRIAARLRLARENGAGEAELSERLARNAADLEARFQLARLLAARENYQAALENLLEVVKRDRAYEDEAARKAMIDVFEVLGPEHELTQSYRSELAKVLFS